MAIRFPEPEAQKEYERLNAYMSADEAHEIVERHRLAGWYIPKHQRLGPMLPAIVGSDDQKRIARKRAMQQMSDEDPDKFDQYKRQADLAGVDITGKSYNSGLAAYPGDPDAWIKDDNDTKAIAKLKGFKTSKEDGLLKLTVPMDMTQQSNRQLLAKPRLTKPTVVQRRNKERERAK